MIQTALSLTSGNLGNRDCCLEFPKGSLTNKFLRSSYKRGSRDSFCVTAKVKKLRKHQYPWPDDMDPNIKSGHLTYLSHFKPLAEKPRLVKLPFEKPLVDLEKKIDDIRNLANETSLDFSDQIGTLEKKYKMVLKDLYTHLTPIQRLSIARHPNRPTVLDHILNITEKWVELHGDRAGYDDPAIVTGIGSIEGKTYMCIGHQKGRNTKENIARNFAMPTPHGFRKALRMMKYADHHGFPILTFVDTPGAYADLKSEELGQGGAIALNLRTMFGLKVPIVTVVTGEGGSGGGFAIACSNKMFMMENSAFYVASPEACAAILWKSSEAAPKAAEKLRITAQEHYRLKIIDGIIPEPLGGAHADPLWASQQIKYAIIQAMEELSNMSSEELIHHRMLKHRHIGRFQEGIPIDPHIKRHMKPSQSTDPNTETEVEDLKNKILKSNGPDDPITAQTIEKKLKQDADKDLTNAFISMGLKEQLASLKQELSKSSNGSPNQPLSKSMNQKVDKIMEEFKQNLSKPGSYMGLKKKLERLDMVNNLIEYKNKSEQLKTDINNKIPPETKAKLKQLKHKWDKNKDRDKDRDIIGGVETEIVNVLKTANLDVIGVMKKNGDRDRKEINGEIEEAVEMAGLGGKIEELRLKMADGFNLKEVEKLEAEIKEKIVEALEISMLDRQST